ncbi:hypothetical protein JEQ12_001665 [Ovis aries]|uniref:Uncharacterized protein n=1 Tax=Ovis aries TaxID=9940 RepID=A0A836ANA2_SHEEP|nr:hypothetical protein JEQ12_001665 [Ovis aries]
MRVPSLIFAGNDIFPVDLIDQLLHQILKGLHDPIHRPDSIFEDQMVYTVRYRCGQQLAIEGPVDADLVSTVSESATPAALGYATKCGLPYVEVLCKNRSGAEFLSASVEGTGELGSISFPDELDCLLEAKFLLVYLPV